MAPEPPVILVDPHDDLGVIRAATDLQNDIERVGGKRPLLCMDTAPMKSEVIIVGTLARSRFLRQISERGRLDTKEIKGKWEASITTIVDDPLPGIGRALVIAGSDKRGAIYGLYDLSRAMGVSPWYWWADVPVRHRDRLWVVPGSHVRSEPAVKYRGIFINDEGPSLTNWVLANYGEFRHGFYERVFELLLRLRANYLWPAMWNNCFNQDDPLNMVLADQYGIVMGTSHVEPMMRADKEWNRLGYTADDWNYLKRPKELEQFWRAGIDRNKPYESIVTIAMRGKIDTPMSEEANIALLEKIVAAQRKIISEEIGPNVRQPQLWALYKEVQEYYEKGMRVPDDVTLLWCDDNWGNIRRLPTLEEGRRSGGAGVYYHFDYVGGPRNYKWLNTNPLPKISEQMGRAFAHGADRIWIVNVGDIKPMEFPLEYFLELGWNPGLSPQTYAKDWGVRNFGAEHGEEVGRLLEQYGKYAGRRKPELIEPDSFSLFHYGEWDRIIDEWRTLEVRASRLRAKLPKDSQSAIFQLVDHPIRAMRIYTELMGAVGKNRSYAKQGRYEANLWAARARSLFKADRDLRDEFDANANGKWKHFMDQTHIGYTGWQQPDADVLPELAQVDGAHEGIGVSVQGSTDKLRTSELDPFGSPTLLDVFQRGPARISWQAVAAEPWLVVKPSADQVAVSCDWSRAPQGRTTGHLRIRAATGNSYVVEVPVLNAPRPPRPFHGYVESGGALAIEPESYTSIEQSVRASWHVVPDYGRTGSGLAVGAMEDLSLKPEDAPRVGYTFYTPRSGPVTVELVMGASLQTHPDRTFRIGVSLDQSAVTALPVPVRYLSPEWEESVRNNARVVRYQTRLEAGVHELHLWGLDQGVVVQRIILDLGGLLPSYLGPPAAKLWND